MGKLIPVIFEYTATHYCKFCNTWGSQMPDDPVCGNCSNVGYLMLNPFPNNLVPYIEMEAADLEEIGEFWANTELSSKLGLINKEGEVQDNV